MRYKIVYCWFRWCCALKIHSMNGFLKSYGDALVANAETSGHHALKMCGNELAELGQ